MPFLSPVRTKCFPQHHGSKIRRGLQFSGDGTSGRLTMLLCFCQFLSFGFFQGFSVFQDGSHDVSYKHDVCGEDGSYGGIIIVTCKTYSEWYRRMTMTVTAHLSIYT